MYHRSVDVLLVAANTERLNMRVLPVGLAMVAAATRRAGHRVHWLDLCDEDDPEAAVAAAVAARQPGAVGISVRNVDDQCMAAPRLLLADTRRIVAACRATTSAPVIVGGAGYSIFPDAALRYLGADAGVRGDGEIAFPELLARLESGRDPGGIPGVHLPGRTALPPARPCDLDALPGPDPVVWSNAAPAGTMVPVQTRRGCPLRCTYCSTPAIEGRRIRSRSPEAAAAGIETLAEAGFADLYLVDNTFNLPPAWALALCREIVRRRLEVRWRCILYPGTVSEELVAAMAAAGCTEAALGFESGCPRVLAALGKRFTTDDVRRAAGLLAEHGIARNGFLLLGGPGEDRDSVAESLSFVDSLDLDGVRVTAGIRIYPDTPLAARARAEGVIAPDDDLLEPRFYLAEGIADTVAADLAGRSRG